MSCSFVVAPDIPLPVPPGTLERAAQEYSAILRTRTRVKICYYIEVEQNAQLPANIYIQPILTRQIVNQLMLELDKGARFTKRLLVEEVKKCEEKIALLTEKVKNLEEKPSTATTINSQSSNIKDDDDEWIELNKAISNEL